MARVDQTFKDNIYKLVASIPSGRVMTYGQLAALCGAPWAAWEVGQIAHFGPSELPWHRVVNKRGGLAKGYSYGGREAQQKALEQEGVAVHDFTVHVEDLLWWPIKN